MVWFVIKTEWREIECIQKNATAWILSCWELNYIQRLSELQRLPFSYYFELHDLTLITLLQGNYKLEFQII